MTSTLKPFAIRSHLLEGDSIAHGFFTREGGVSQGLYASLNGGVGSNDDAQAVAENRRRMAELSNGRLARRSGRAAMPLLPAGAVSGLA